MQSVVWLLALYIAGSAIMFALGAKRLRSFVFAPVISIAFLGILSLGTYVYAWTVSNVILWLIVVLVICFFGRAFVDRKKSRDPMRIHFGRIRAQANKINKAALTAVLFGVLASLIYTTYVFSGISLESPIGIQGYDNPFHFSVVKRILETGIASPIGAGSVMGDSNAIYPSLWHAFVALNIQVFGGDILLSSWAICILFIGLIAPIGSIALTKAIFKSPNPFSLFLAAVLPSIAARSLFSFVVFGSLFANIAGTALLPLALAWIVFSYSCYADSERRRRFIAVTTALLICIIALGLAHPSAAFALLIFFIPFVVSKIPKVWEKIVVAVVSCACWFALTCSPFFFRTIYCTDLLGRDFEMGHWLVSKFGFDYYQLATLDLLPLSVFVICMTVGVLLAVGLRKKFLNSWFIFPLAFISSQWLCALFPENWFSIILTGFWYRDISRFLILLILMAGCVVAYIPTLVEMFLNRFSNMQKSRVGKTAIIMSVLLVCIIGANYGNSYREMLRYDSTTAALTPQENAFMEQVAEISDGGVVLNNADNNSVWMHPIYGVNALINGRPSNQMSSMSDELCILIEGIDRIGEQSSYGEEVRAAADVLDLSYVVKMNNRPNITTRFDDHDRIVYQYESAILNVNPDTPGLELVYELDGMQLYKVDLPYNL